MEPELFLFGYLCGPVKDRRYGSGIVALVRVDFVFNKVTILRWAESL
jgi:hypothetical protein